MATAVDPASTSRRPATKRKCRQPRCTRGLAAGRPAARWVNDVPKKSTMTTQARIDAPPDMNGRHRHTYEAIFRHPAAHNLEWHDVRSLLAALGGRDRGPQRLTPGARNGHTATFHAPKHKDVASVEDLLAIRHFLEESAAPATIPTA